jgi:5'-nucleotidase / UDP-sugar diphosphatase
MLVKQTFKRLLACSLAVGLISSQLAMPALAEGSQKHRGNYHKNYRPFNLSIMHTNDSHARLDNVAKKVTAVKEVRAAKPDALLLDAGDVFSGTLYFNEFKGQADLEFMNLMDYDFMTFGNHEFDLGSSPEGHKALADFVKNANFPFVSTNVNFSKDQNLKSLYKNQITYKAKDSTIYPAVVKKVNGEKVGFIGLTTEETADISSPEGVVFDNYIKEATKTVKSLERRGINKIVAITHLGYDDNPEYDNDLQLAKFVDGIDVIVGGHSHTQLNAPVIVSEDEKGREKDPTVIVQAYQYSDYLGTLDVQFNTKGEVVGQAGQLIKIADKAADPEAAELLKKYSSKITELKNKSTGATSEKVLDNPRLTDNPDKSVRRDETELGNLITDGMLDKAKDFNPNVVMAFQNGGGIRASIDPGEITYGDVLTTLPFGNTLATMKLTGAEIKEALEHSVSQAPAESGGFLHVSGMKFTYDSTKAAGSRVLTMDMKNVDGTYTAIDPAKEYMIATNAFTAKGGDGFTVFKTAYEQGRVTDLGASDWENLRDYVAELVNVNPVIEGRIVDVGR